MLSNKFYDNNSAELVEIINKIETDLMYNITRTIGKNQKIFKKIEGDTTAILDWRTEKLTKLGGLNERNIKLITGSADKQIREIETILNNASDAVLSQREGQLLTGVEQGLLVAAPSIEDSTVINNLIDNINIITREDFNRLNNTMLTQANQQYRTIINTVSAQMVAGTKTGNQAMRTMVYQLADNGITGFIDSAGRRWSPEAYANLLIRSNSKELAKQVVLARNREYGNNFIEVSSHSDARPKCAEDQGQVYDQDNSIGIVEDGLGNEIPYKAWSSTTVGEPDGILGKQIPLGSLNKINAEYKPC